MSSSFSWLEQLISPTFQEYCVNQSTAIKVLKSLRESNPALAAHLQVRTVIYLHLWPANKALASPRFGSCRSQLRFVKLPPCPQYVCQLRTCPLLWPLLFSAANHQISITHKTSQLLPCRVTIKTHTCYRFSTIRKAKVNGVVSRMLFTSPRNSSIR